MPVPWSCPLQAISNYIFDHGITLLKRLWCTPTVCLQDAAQTFILMASKALCNIHLPPVHTSVPPWSTLNLTTPAILSSSQFQNRLLYPSKTHSRVSLYSLNLLHIYSQLNTELKDHHFYKDFLAAPSAPCALQGKTAHLSLHAHSSYDLLSLIPVAL